jgi:hypothetical protein
VARTLLERISEAEELVEVCEEAEIDAQIAMRLAQEQAPRFPDRRILSPAERTAYWSSTRRPTAAVRPRRPWPVRGIS